MIKIYAEGSNARQVDDFFSNHKYVMGSENGRTPKLIGEIFLKQGINHLCFYISEPSDNFLEFFENNRQEQLKSWEYYYLLNEFILKYLRRYFFLADIKHLILPQSSLTLKFPDYITQQDITGLTAQTILEISKLGLGIGYVHT
jgi:hypothetical protein